MEENSQSKINFVPTLKWVRKGVAKSNPEKVQLSKEELVRIINETKNNLVISDNNEEQATSSDVNGVQSASDEFNFNQYDVETDAQALGIGSLAELPTEAEDNFSESDDSDKEDDIVKPHDNLILVGHVEGDASILEVYVYNEEEESLYVHHDFLLPSYPLCIEWLDYEPGQSEGSYCAIGSMSPVIEVWDLDIVNCLEPAYKLGRKGNRKKGISKVGHTDAVLSLSWNRNYHHIMASGSVDKSILLWDIDQKEPATCIKAFEEKVQCVQWHPLEAQTLLAGACDHTVKVFDCQAPDNYKSWQTAGEVELVTWNTLDPFAFFVGTNNGIIEYYDVRKGKIWSVEAHEKEVTGLAVSGQCPGLLVTSSADGSVKTWDFQGVSEPRLVHDKNFQLGLIHSLGLCPDLPFVIAVGGDNKSNNFTVFDLQNIDPVKHHFGSRSLVQLVPQTEDQEMAESTSTS